MKYRKKKLKTAVVAVVRDRDGRVLLTKRAVPPYRNKWVMPGGKIDPGEPITIALKREVREEVGLDIHIEGLVDLFEIVPSGEHPEHFIILYYFATPKNSDLTPNPDEVADVVWANWKTADSLDLPDGTRRILSKVFGTQDGKSGKDGKTLLPWPISQNTE